MDDLQPRRLTRKSQALALDEFQMLDLNLHLIKNVDDTEDQQDNRRNSMKETSSRSLLAKGSNFRLRQSESRTKSNKDPLLSRRKSLSMERMAASSSATEILKQKMSKSFVEENAESRRTSEIEPEAVPSLEENFLQVIELNKLQEYVKIDDKKPENVHFQEKKLLSCGSIENVDRRDICRDKTCLDSKVHLPPINRTDSQNAIWDIKGLGVPPAAVKKKTLTIQRVEMRRKERHDYIVKEIDLRMNDLNDVIEQEIRREANNLTANIQMIKENVEQIMTTIKEKPCGTLNVKLVARMQEIMKQLNDSRLTKIDSFCEYVRKLEKHRSERFKMILKNAYKEMHVNMYLMPYEIQKFFENKVQHLNEITINNYHCYTELEKKLKLQMEEENRLWFQSLKCNDTISKAVEEEEIGLREPPIAEVSRETMKGPTKEDILKKLEKAEEDFHRLKIVASKLKYLKSHPTIEVFENYLEEMRSAANALFYAGFIGRQGLNLDQKTIQDLSTMHCMDEEELQKMWSDAIQEMLLQLDNNLRSFSNSTRIFDCYFDRLEELRTLYRQQLFLVQTKNDKQTVQMNNIMNILIDTLRQDVNEENLNKTIQQIQATILSIDTLIQNHLKEETALVDKFSQLSISNVDILIEELDRFVKQFVPPPDSDPRKMKKRASWMDVDELKTNDHLFSKDFLNCRFLMQGMDNWQFGVWHALVTAMDSSKQIIAVILEKWTNTEKQKLTRRSEMKGIINNVRIHQMRDDFWKVRLAELKIHEERFVQHDLAVRDKIAQLGYLKRNIIEICKNYSDTEYSNKIKDIMNETANIKKERHVIGIINKLKTLNASAANEMKERHENFKKNFYKIINDVRSSHLLFMKSIRLFSEDGNFTADEAKALVKKITAMEKLMSKEFLKSKENIEDIYDDFVDDCRGKLEAPLSTLNKALEEFTFRDEVDRKLKKLQLEVAEGVQNLTYDIRKLNGKMRSWHNASYSDDNLGSYDFLFTFSRCFKEILADINTLSRRLYYDDTLAPNEKLLRQKIEISQVSLTPTVLAAKGKKGQESKGTVDESSNPSKKFERKRSIRSTSALIKTKNYVFLLYALPPQDDGSFFSSLHLKNYSSYCDIQEAAKIFYETHGEILDSDRVPPDYKCFVEGTMQKYKYYQLQIEFAWLENAIEFYDSLTYFHRFLGNYYGDTLTKYFESRKKKLMEKCSEVMKNMNENMKSVEDNYTSIHNKLKPMFGHPEKARTLAVIETYINQADDFNERILINNLEPSKELIKQHCIKTETIFLDMERILSCIKSSTTLLTLYKQLEDKIFERIDVLQEILSLDNLSELDVANQTDFDMYMRNRLQEYKRTAPIPPECLITYMRTTQSMASIESSTHLDVEEWIRSNFHEYEKLAEKIENLRTKCTAIHEEYKTMWAQDIERIVNLFKIKYDKPIIPDQ